MYQPSVFVGKFEENGCFEWLQAKKEAGLVRHAGLSVHDTTEALGGLLTRRCPFPAGPSASPPCIGCRACKRACPQHLPIVKHLEDVAARFES